MGGTIKVDSEVGKGTTFQIILPVKIDNKQKSIDEEENHLIFSTLPFQTNRSALIEQDSTITTSTIVKPSLLIIEDNPDVVIYLKSCLEEFYQLEVAYNGRIGIEKALEKIPDLIVSDVMMPEKDGYEVCDRLKNEESTSHIPIVLLTAKADATSKMNGLRRGADAYLAKPFHKEELLIRLNGLIKRQQRLMNFFSKHSNNGDTTTLPDKQLAESIQGRRCIYSKST